MESRQRKTMISTEKIRSLPVNYHSNPSKQENQLVLSNLKQWQHWQPTYLNSSNVVQKYITSAKYIKLSMDFKSVVANR